MVDIVNRAEWGARPPRSVNRTTWAQRVGVAVHYSGGSPTSTPRDLQNYAMDQLGYTDTHYNFFVDRNGVAYEGRGWLVVAAHAKDQNTAWVGVCFIGRDPDVTDAAKATIRALYDEACRLAGRTLLYSGHGQLPGQNTDCPGATLRAWVASGMPYPEGDDDDMTPEQALQLTRVELTLGSFIQGMAQTVHQPYPGGESKQYPIVPNVQLASMDERLAALSSPTLTDEQLVTLADLIAARLPAPAVPPTPQEIADAVTDEQSRRLAQ